MICDEWLSQFNLPFGLNYWKKSSHRRLLSIHPVCCTLQLCEFPCCLPKRHIFLSWFWAKVTDVSCYTVILKIKKKVNFAPHLQPVELGINSLSQPWVFIPWQCFKLFGYFTDWILFFLKVGSSQTFALSTSMQETNFSIPIIEQRALKIIIFTDTATSGKKKCQVTPCRIHHRTMITSISVSFLFFF